ncbi:BQ5605_C028g10571 [Microbotryum silenes-dioicae]|uniref:BQ5605_C028g10571 protein n=1 Tax=Microbotryum silenes-dioicae TaxID=796604 RepID=A0A2X0MLH9_9BASI|nr:BQ5605_C028g10571 [Microbotryum silenes-dioicae]
MPTARSIPKYRPAPTRLPPAKLPMFRSVVSHPPPPFAVAQAEARAQEGAGKGTQGVQQSGSTVPPSGSHQLFFSTAPRSLIPLTTSPSNHKLWNPPAADSKAGRAVERDESGRLAKFASRFAGLSMQDADGGTGGGKGGQFDVESDLSFLEGATVQSSGKALGKKEIVGVKSAKQGKK